MASLFVRAAQRTEALAALENQPGLVAGLFEVLARLDCRYTVERERNSMKKTTLSAAVPQILIAPKHHVVFSR